jgi:hypothetical protein
MRSALVTFAVTLMGLAAGPALADDHRQHQASAPLLPAYQQECGSCHLAFPPSMLPAPSWQRLMGNLPRHFGTDASLDAPATQQLAAYLAANASDGSSKRRTLEQPPQDRISRLSWFVHKHDEVPSDAWKRKAIGSAANCAACHPGAADGNFNEHQVRIPR